MSVGISNLQDSQRAKNDGTRSTYSFPKQRTESALSDRQSLRFPFSVVLNTSSGFDLMLSMESQLSLLQSVVEILIT